MIAVFIVIGIVIDVVGPTGNGHPQFRPPNSGRISRISVPRVIFKVIAPGGRRTQVRHGTIVSSPLQATPSGTDAPAHPTIQICGRVKAPPTLFLNRAGTVLMPTGSAILGGDFFPIHGLAGTA